MPPLGLRPCYLLCDPRITLYKSNLARREQSVSQIWPHPIQLSPQFTENHDFQGLCPSVDNHSIMPRTSLIGVGRLRKALVVTKNLFHFQK